MLRLLFHYHSPVVRDEQGNIWIDGAQGKLLDEMARHCEKLVLFLHEGVEVPQDYKIMAPNIEFISMGKKGSITERIFKARYYRRLINENRHRFNCALLRGFSPMLPSIGKSLSPTPVSYLIGADIRSSIKHIRQPLWRKTMIWLWSKYNYRQRQRVLSSSLITFVNGPLIHEQVKEHAKHVHETTVSCTLLSSANFLKTPLKPAGGIYRLLYTGRIVRDKGLFELVGAVKVLRAKGYDVRLDLVGYFVRNERSSIELVEEIRSAALEDVISIHGHVPFDPDLLQFYRNAFAFVIPTYYEGFPRCIWEAMGNGLPVIATKVGNIPNYLKDNDEALLIEPKSVDDIVNAMLRLISDDKLRSDLAENGYQRALKNGTLESKVQEITDMIKARLAEERS